jgi:quinol monooxygenase YgiN
VEPLYIFAPLEPLPGKRDALREVIKAVVEPTRAEAGCIRVNVYESDTGFYIHSKWQDKAAFEAHRHLPHTVRFVAQASELITHPLKAIRTREIL